VSELKITRGSVNFTTENAMTLEDISNLAEAGKIAGIPPSSIVTYVSFHYGMGRDGAGTQIDINWSVQT
jgi:hypothetical protein